MPSRSSVTTGRFDRVFEPKANPQSRAFRPNIVYLLVDDLGYADVGFTSSRDIRTPRIGRLTREGLHHHQITVVGFVTPTIANLS